MFEWLTPELIWFCGGIILVFMEFVIPGVILVFFGVGAILTSALTWIGILPGVTEQLIVFGVSSLTLLFALRKYASKFFKGDSTEEKESEYSGKIAVVTQSIIPGSLKGKVSFEGTDWKAVSQVKIPEGTSVLITGKNNITLMVKPVN